jgi:hypothetical protein
LSDGKKEIKRLSLIDTEKWYKSHKKTKLLLLSINHGAQQRLPQASDDQYHFPDDQLAMLFF